MLNGSKTLVIFGFLLALEIILRRVLAFNTSLNSYSLGFVAIAVAGYLYGAPGGMLVAALGDIIGASLFPVGGNFFWGFTLTALLNGAVLGLFLHHKHFSLLRVILAVLLTQLLFSQFVNTYWLSLLISKRSYWQLFFPRLFQTSMYVIFEPLVIFSCISCLKLYKKFNLTVGN